MKNLKCSNVTVESSSRQKNSDLFSAFRSGQKEETHRPITAAVQSHSEVIAGKNGSCLNPEFILSVNLLRLSMIHFLHFCLDAAGHFDWVVLECWVISVFESKPLQTSYNHEMILFLFFFRFLWCWMCLRNLTNGCFAGNMSGMIN